MIFCYHFYMELICRNWWRFAALVAFLLVITLAQAEPTSPTVSNSGASTEASGTIEPVDQDSNVEKRVVRRNGTTEETRSAIVGVQDILTFDFMPKSGMPGSAKVLSIEPNPNNPNQIIVTPLSAGTTSLTVLDVQGRIRYKYTYNVTANDMSQKVIAIRELLKDIEGIFIRVVDNKIILDGELVVPRDYDRILKVIEAYKSEGVVDLVSMSRLSLEAIAKKMQEEINKEPGGVNVQVRLANETFFLMGTVDNSIERDRAEIVAKTYLPERLTSVGIQSGAIRALLDKDRPPIMNMIIVNEQPPAPPPKMVRVTVHFVEIGKEFLKSSFFKWAPFLSEGSGMKFGPSTTGGITTSTQGSFAGTISNLFPKLQAGSNGGFARVLYSTVGVGLDGELLDIRRADSVPYISVMNGVPNSDAKDVGVNVSVTPTIVGEDKVKLDNTIEISTLAGAGASSSAPRLARSKFANKIIVRSGESAVIGGLVSNDTAKDVDKDPEAAPSGAGSPLFTLLRSKAFRNKKTQFVIFVSPKIVNDAATETADIKNKIINNNKQRKRALK